MEFISLLAHILLYSVIGIVMLGMLLLILVPDYDVRDN